MQPGDFEILQDLANLIERRYKEAGYDVHVYVHNPEETKDMGKRFTVVPHDPAIGGTTPMAAVHELSACVSIPLDGLTDKAAEFASIVRKGLSAEWCKCVWTLHPEDTDVPEGKCRECLGAQDEVVHSPNSDEFHHSYRGRRKRMVQEHPLCPAHTAGGLVLGFLQWLNPEDERLAIPDMLIEQPENPATMSAEQLSEFLARKRAEGAPLYNPQADSGSPEDD